LDGNTQPIHIIICIDLKSDTFNIIVFDLSACMWECLIQRKVSIKVINVSIFWIKPGEVRYISCKEEFEGLFILQDLCVLFCEVLYSSLYEKFCNSTGKLVWTENSCEIWLKWMLDDWNVRKK